MLPMPVRVNVTLTDLSRISRAGLLNGGTEKTVAQNWVGQLDMRIASLEQAALDLSGGNQQKLVIAKWLFRDAEVLMLDEPTRGIDVGAKAEIFHLLDGLVHNGAAILMISSEQIEIVHICDRAYVMRSGHIVGELSHHELTEANIVRLGIHQ